MTDHLSIIVQGRLTRDAELKTVGDRETLLVSFSIACNRYVNRKEEVFFFDVSLFGDRFRKVGEGLQKGTLVTIPGEFSTREYEGKTYLKVTGHEVSINAYPRGSGDGDSRPSSPSPNSRQKEFEDDIPI